MLSFLTHIAFFVIYLNVIFMYLKTLKLWNFRLFGSGSKPDPSEPDLIVDFQKGLNVLVGENDSGKTAIIDAIRLILNTFSSERIYPELSDFHNKSEEFRIECRFEDLEDEEAKNFIEWLGMAGEGETAKPYLKVMLQVSQKEERIQWYDVKAGADDEGYPLTGEAREYLRVTYLKPLRDAKSELVPKRGSRLSQILFGLEDFKRGDDNGHELLTLFQDFNIGISEYFNSGKGKILSEKLNSYLYDFLFLNNNETKASFEVPTKKMKDILEILKLVLGDENKGLGSHNALFIATELLNLVRPNWCGLRLGLIEELEAHLHPQLQMRVVEKLQELSKENDQNVQFIISTHSPNLASKVKLENLIIVSNKNAFPMNKEYTHLDEFGYRFLHKFLDVTKSNMFFAKGVIMVEGWSEELIIPALANKIECDLTKHGVSIVNVGHKSFLNYANIFRRKDEKELNIPVSIITDLDAYPDDPTNDDYVTYNNGKESIKKIRTDRLKELQQEYDFESTCLRSFISPFWTLEYCLAKSYFLKDVFLKAIKNVHPNIDTANIVSEVHNKLKSNTLDKTKLARELSLQLENQDIVRDSIQTNDAAFYLIEAIEHATGKN